MENMYGLNQMKLLSTLQRFVSVFFLGVYFFDEKFAQDP